MSQIFVESLRSMRNKVGYYQAAASTAVIVLDVVAVNERRRAKASTMTKCVRAETDSESTALLLLRIFFASNELQRRISSYTLMEERFGFLRKSNKEITDAELSTNIERLSSVYSGDLPHDMAPEYRQFLQFVEDYFDHDSTIQERYKVLKTLDGLKCTYFPMWKCYF